MNIERWILMRRACDLAETGSAEEIDAYIDRLVQDGDQWLLDLIPGLIEALRARVLGEGCDACA